MNKTVTINIAGMVFHIEEDAYERLKSYLDSLRHKFSAEEGRDEILADIESRIAEILTAKKGPAREVVVMSDIEDVIATMGEPETISEESNTQASEQGSAQSQTEDAGDNYNRRTRRRLFRDPDDKVVGGVCSGIGHYFDIDPVWLRLGFALTLILAGTGALFYILLMIIIPKAETTAEKLEMHGDPVDVNNIRRSIKEEMEEMGERMKNFGKKQKAEWGKADYDYRNRSRYHRRRGDAEDFLRTIGSLLGRFLAFCLVVFGVLMLIGLFTGTFFITDFGPDVISAQARSLFDDPTSYYVAIVGGILVFGVPLVTMVYSGILILLRIKRNNKIIGFSALGVWIVGLIMAIVSITNAAAGFSETSESAERVTVVNPHNKNLTLRVTVDPDMVNEYYDDEFNKRHHYTSRWKMVTTAENNWKIGAQLNIVPAVGDSIELYVYKKSQGRTIDEAQERVRNISYLIKQDSTTITFAPAFTFGEATGWKAQEVDVELRIPIGTTIFLDRTCNGFIWDIDNVHRVHDDNMTDRRWIMTDKGLECVDCAGLDLDPNGVTESEFEKQIEFQKKMDSAEKTDTL
jgi:phage shock protein PspC (stress-responsive transcriptional regulator)